MLVQRNMTNQILRHVLRSMSFHNLKGMNFAKW